LLEVVDPTKVPDRLKAFIDENYLSPDMSTYIYTLAPSKVGDEALYAFAYLLSKFGLKT